VNSFIKPFVKNIPVGAIVTGSVGAFVAPVAKPKE